MSIIFEIEQLGQIRDSVIEFKPFLLFFGNSNTGKSCTALAIYYLQYLLLEDKNILKEIFDIKNIENTLKNGSKIDLIFSIKKIENYYNKNLNNFMGYMLGNENFKCNVKLRLKNIADLDYSLSEIKPENEDTAFKGNYIQLIISGNQVLFPLNYIPSLFRFILRKFIYPYIFKTDNFYRSLFLLPPARGALMGISFSMKKELTEIGLYKEFVNQIEKLNYPEYSPIRKIRQKKELTDLLNQIFQGDIKFRQNKYYYNYKDNNIPLTAAASSIKELSPLNFILKKIPPQELSILIEEPEAHLHPELQRKVSLILSYLVNEGSFIQATTHSDFFINQINNLIKLYYIKKSYGERSKQFKDILKKTGIDKKFILNPEKIGAYYFGEKDGFIHSEKLKISEKGIPLKSFDHTYRKSIEQTRYLRGYIDNE